MCDGNLSQIGIVTHAQLMSKLSTSIWMGDIIACSLLLKENYGIGPISKTFKTMMWCLSISILNNCISCAVSAVLTVEDPSVIMWSGAKSPTRC